MELEAIAVANEIFYNAFASRDLDVMDRMWAKESPVSCIHPGWVPIFGRQGVMESWAAILGNPASPKIHCADPRVTLAGAIAFIVCFENLSGTLLAATNIFVLEDDEWRLIHHQAGATSEPDPVRSSHLH
jgi:SnoaL-like protein